MYFRQLCIAFGLLGPLLVIPAVAIVPTASVNSNISITFARNKSVITPSACCFVVQDTVTEDWWPQYTTTPVYALFNLTSITAVITPYPNATITGYNTNVYRTNTTGPGTVIFFENPLVLLNEFVPGPTEISNPLDLPNITQIVTGGMTVKSPTAFNVYTTVKIITVPPVTNSLGAVVCGTQSTYFSNSVATCLRGPFTFVNTYPLGPIQYSGMNSNAQAYFGGRNLSGPSPTSRTDTITGVTISLTTPFIRTQSRGTWTAPNGCMQEGLDVTEIYGYVPQTLVDHLVANPYYSSQYPGLASCLPGGPVIVPPADCHIAYCTANLLPSLIEPLLGGLTGYTSMTVTPLTLVPSKTFLGLTQTLPTTVGPLDGSLLIGQTGVFVTLPTQEPTPMDGPQQMFTPTVIPPEQSMNSEAIPQLGTQAPQVTSDPVQPKPNPTPEAGSFIPQIVPEQGPTPQATADEETPTPPVFPGQIPPILESQNPSIPSADDPTSPAATLNPAESPTNLFPIILIAPTTIALNPSSPDEISIPGSTTVISGTTNVIVSAAPTAPVILFPSTVLTAPTTIALNPLLPYDFQIPGSTTVISGTANVIVSAAPTAPIILGGTNLFPSIILTAPTTMAVNPLFPNVHIPGITTVISGTMNVIVSAAPTAPVTLGGTELFPSIVLTAPTTIALNPLFPNVQIPGSTTVISGTTEVIVSAAPTAPVTLGGGNLFPSLVLTAPTTIALNPLFPNVLIPGSTTVISGTTEVIVSAAPTAPVTIGGYPEFFSSIVLTAPTTIALNSLVPDGILIPGRTTVISGITEVIVSAAPIAPVTLGEIGGVIVSVGEFQGIERTSISGSEYEIFEGPTTIPVDSKVSLKGETTVISGVTEVILTAATTVPVNGGGDGNATGDIVPLATGDGSRKEFMKYWTIGAFVVGLGLETWIFW